MEPEAGPLPVLWLRDIKPVLAAADFVQGLLLQGGAAVLYGESNSGKTFLVTDLALHVAAGISWNGRRVDPGSVVYCVLEGGNGFRNRVAAWRDAHPELDVDIPFAAIPCALNLLDPGADVPRLIDAIHAASTITGQPAKLVVIDTLSRALAGGDENSSEDMGGLVRAMDAIREATGACVLFVHHSGKDAAKGARGHSLLRAAVDTEIEVRVDEDTGVRTATVVKQRDLVKGAKFDFRLEVVTLGTNQHDEPVTTCTVVSSAPSSGRPPKSLKRLSVEEEGWLKDLRDYFEDPRNEVHEGIRPDPEMGATRGATRDCIKTWLVRRGRLSVAPGVAADGALTATSRSHLMRYLNRLKDKGKIGLLNEWVWLL
jgi:KaiC/GvpD/RAD55 family RecA-like ATPase